MVTAYTGNSPYCYANSLHMCLTHVDMASVPDVGLLECMTGMPFGASFIAQERPVFFPSPARPTSPDSGLTRALDTIGWTCDTRRFEDADAAMAALREALRTPPVLIGPLDMGWLPYDPAHAYKRGGDHFVVGLGLAGDLVEVHDPQFFPFATLPLADLMHAWNAKGIGYSLAAYTFRASFRAQRTVSEAQMLSTTLGTAREIFAAVPTGPVMFGGALAFSRAADMLRTGPPEAFTGALTFFALPLGARRCIDAARFFEKIGKTDAARLMAAKARVYGRAQYPAAQKDFKRAAELFDELAAIEAQIARLV